MAICSTLRDEPIENPFYIARDIRIGVFVDSNACGGVRHIHVTPAAFYAGLLDRLLDRTRNVHEFRAPAGFNSERLHLKELQGTGMMKCVPPFLMPECRSISSKAGWPQRAANGRKDSSRDCRVLRG